MSHQPSPYLLNFSRYKIFGLILATLKMSKLWSNDVGFPKFFYTVFFSTQMHNSTNLWQNRRRSGVFWDTLIVMCIRCLFVLQKRYSNRPVLYGVQVLSLRGNYFAITLALLCGPFFNGSTQRCR